VNHCINGKKQATRECCGYFPVHKGEAAEIVSNNKKITWKSTLPTKETL
jgi:hypothetical protein